MRRAGTGPAASAGATVHVPLGRPAERDAGGPAAFVAGLVAAFPPTVAIEFVPGDRELLLEGSAAASPPR